MRELPQDYRHRLSPGYERVPHGDVERNWKKWEKEKYWDRRGEHDRGGHGEQGHGGMVIRTAKAEMNKKAGINRTKADEDECYEK